MTCIVGLVHKGHVTIGGDSAAISNLDIISRKDPKVFHIGEFIIGFTSSFRMGQLIGYVFVPPPIPDTGLMGYMVGPFVDALRKCLKDGGYASKQNEVESGGVFLVGVRGRLFLIDCDYQVGESHDDLSAAGCGRDYALGSLHATPHMSPKKRVRLALEAAEEFSAGVCGPFNLITI